MKQIESTLNKKQIILSRIIVGIALVLWGALLVLAALGLFDVSVKRLALPLFFCVCTPLLLTLSIIQQNTLLLWLFSVVLMLFLGSMLFVYDILPINKLYPLLIAAPALGSLSCGIYSSIWKDHIKIILIFAPSSLIFCLNTSFGLSIGITFGVFLIYIGTGSIIHTLISKYKTNKKTSGDNND